ncbi:hypothetical protein DRN74_03510 [Candidatus Micrarchaeota archaeon]|mgnify:CR=1 FL=1|nr:MAG: hypothetical protein DRN74_03510 [Candidatus Micrarchaeota archaeon]
MEERIENAIELSEYWLKQGIGQAGISKKLVKRGYNKEEIRFIISQVFNKKRRAESKKKSAKRLLYLLFAALFLVVFYLYLWPPMLSFFVETFQKNPGPSWTWLTVNQSSQKLGGYTLLYAENSPLKDFRGFVCGKSVIEDAPELVNSAILLAQSENNCSCSVPKSFKEDFKCSSNTLLYTIPASREAELSLNDIAVGDKVIITVREVEEIEFKNTKWRKANARIVMVHRAVKEVE